MSKDCELCGCEDSKLHFMSCVKLNASNQGKQLFQNLKSEISKFRISPIFWDIITQALREETVSIPAGTPSGNFFMFAC